MTEAVPRFGKPTVIHEDHDLSTFDCGEAVLDDWLRKRALANLHLGASRTYVVCRSQSREVVAYYSLAMGNLSNREATGSMRRNMPNLIPAVVIGRLAASQSCQGFGLGGALLSDAVMRSRQAAQHVATRLVIVHAISAAAEAFYLRHGFVRLPVETPTLAVDLYKLETLLLG
jgi:predicted GNAT family N-acyltransferase